MVYELSREIRIALGIGLIVFVVTYLLILAVWCIIKHMIIHHKKRICEHEPVCLCSRDWCFRCDWYKGEK